MSRHLARVIVPVLGGGFLLGSLVAGCGGRGDETADGGATPPPVEIPRGEAGSAGSRPEGDASLTDLAYLRTLAPTAEVLTAMGTAFVQRGELDSALVQYRRAAELDPDNPAVWNFLGICLARMDRFDEAEEAYVEALNADAFDATSHVNLGNLYYRRGNVDRAIAEYRLATSIDSTDAKAWLNLGLAYEQKEDMTNPAILAYYKAAECDDEDPAPWERLGWIYYDHMLYKSARERWQEAVRRDSTRTDLEENIRTLEAYADSTNTP